MALTSTAQTFRSGGLNYCVTAVDEVAVIALTDDAGASLYHDVVIVPETVYYEDANYHVTAIADSAFFQSAVTEVQVGNQVTRIGVDAFAQADQMQSITLPIGLERVSSGMLRGTAIGSIALPDGVTQVGEGAFADCQQLRTLMLPHSLQRMEAGALDGCTNLYELYCAAPVPPQVGEQDVRGVELVVPDDNSADAYQADSVWGNFGNFSLWVADDLDVTARITDEPLDDHWQRVALGGGLGYRIYDEMGYLLALTAADHFYLQQSERPSEITIVPTNLLAQSVPVAHRPAPAPAIGDLELERTHPIITGHDGTIHVHGDNYGTWTQVYDVYGQLWYQRPSVDGVIVLPINRAYIIIVGDYVKKIWL